MKWSSRHYLIAFNMIPGVGGRRLQALESYFGTLKAAWEASGPKLRKVGGIGSKIAETLVKSRPLISPHKEEEWARALGGRIITIVDQDYPEYLKRLAVPPPVLYVRGTLPQNPGIAVVGTRRPSQAGIKQSRLFSGYLARQQEVVISGLARGIDYVAHRAALEAGGQTIAVLGSNLERIYPAEHRGLIERIIENGAVVSEFSSRCQTVPGNFPRRNRIIAGFSKGVLVVQAGRKSGALLTADWALDLGLDVWALPGEIYDPLREGTNYLIQQGAYLVTKPQDLVKGEILPADSLSKVNVLYQQGLHVNEIAARLKLPIQEVLAEVSLLQVQGGH